MGSILDSWIAREEKKALFWWAPKQGINMGDELSRSIVTSILALEGKSLLSKRTTAGRLLAIGSIIHFSKPGDTIWGSGINGKRPHDSLNTNGLRFSAVRGPFTREILLEKGAAVPEVYGDPGLLAPLFMAKKAFPHAEPSDFLVVPHLNEDLAKYQDYADKLLPPNLSPGEFIGRMLGAKLVVSSSLHGIILAEAYGIPAVYFDSGSGEHILKYNDYYAGTGRKNWNHGTSVAECLSIGGQEHFDLAAVQKNLLAAFPWELWQ